MICHVINEWSLSDTDIWGEDARVFKPERWLDSGVADKKLPVIGVYTHLQALCRSGRLLALMYALQIDALQRNQSLFRMALRVRTCVCKQASSLILPGRQCLGDPSLPVDAGGQV
jgi:hypothetical protein